MSFSDETELLKEIQSLRKTSGTLGNPPSQINPSIAVVLCTLIEMQKQLLDRQINQNVIKMASTNYTANSIQIFKGNIIDNAFEWIKEVERISDKLTGSMN
ncbi:uncharacterized protein TNCT_173651 [Trichonephila clavata]|uniref:Uncharacterized protein n=1 Tax=Trichonephila clavata TaxID=2740835 RepID=A0A8X6FR17_TRICU|nr:uncharacterized protein TNCT_173651 [Trichonephila clavata]